ncbi:MAG: hypothetical protein D6705_00145 [Deltaproteobacteria bacterium]|nr:MAG: hypothetical protein D6705_00145 [Deltaproteobacteria bacterium]
MLLVAALACATKDGDDATSGTTAPATSTGDTGDSGAAGCADGDMPPDCYDQGPRQCSDATIPATCQDGVWTCPNGYDLGGFGDGCCWEPDC